MDLITIGEAAALFQEDPRAIRLALNTCGAKPPLILSGVEYFERADCAKAIATIAEITARQRMKRHG